MDVDFTPAKSTADLPISDPIHAPCPDMAGCENFEPALTKKSLEQINDVRKKLGIKRRTKAVTRIPERFNQPEEASDFHKYGAKGRLLEN